LFIGFRGEGECYLNGEWQPMRAGDVLFAPPGLLHGARNAKHDGEPFITCGGPTPFDPMLYRLAGVSPEVL
jgi:quercetin dioxygenase-like cupin family protein